MTDLDKVVETIKRNVPAFKSVGPFTIVGSECPDEQNRRYAVTMNKPLEAWGAPDSFHRTLALHIDTVTFAACGKGILDEDNLSPWVWYPLCALLLLMFGLIVWRFA